MISMELEVFLEMARLPEGFRFKEWGDAGCTICPVPNDGTGTFFDSIMIAIEKIENRSFKAIEITRLRGIPKQPVTIGVEEISKIIRNAIRDLDERQPNAALRERAFMAMEE